MDTDEIAIPVNKDTIYSVGNAVHNLRVRLWKEHLGITDVEDESMIDPITAADIMHQVACKVCTKKVI